MEIEDPSSDKGSVLKSMSYSLDIHINVQIREHKFSFCCYVVWQFGDFI